VFSKDASHPEWLVLFFENSIASFFYPWKQISDGSKTLSRPIDPDQRFGVQTGHLTLKKNVYGFTRSIVSKKEIDKTLY
jgi:hypothetical protein